MLNLYATSKLYNQLDEYEKNTDKLIKSFANPSLQKRLSKYPLDDDSLCAVSPELRDLLQSDVSDEVKMRQRQKALITMVASDDKKLSALLDAVMQQG